MGRASSARNKVRNRRKNNKDGTTGIGPVAPDHPKFKEYESHLKSRDEGFKAGQKNNQNNNKSDGSSTASKVANAAGAIGDLASKMASFHADSFKGLSPSATAVREGVKPYNYQPESMTPKAETSPMVRYDSDYEKEKKKLGL